MFLVVRSATDMIEPHDGSRSNYVPSWRRRRRNPLAHTRRKIAQLLRQVER